jgi:F0F1-type ATP synthase membrane subunit b/b'
MEQAGETVRHFASQGELGLVLGTLIVIVLVCAAVGVYVARMFGSRIDSLTEAIRAEIDRAREATTTARAEHEKAHALILSELGELRKESEEARRDAEKAAERRDTAFAQLMGALKAALVERSERRMTPHGGLARPAELAASGG